MHEEKEEDEPPLLPFPPRAWGPAMLVCSGGGKIDEDSVGKVEDELSDDSTASEEPPSPRAEDRDSDIEGDKVPVPVRERLSQSEVLGVPSSRLVTVEVRPRMVYVGI